MLPFVTRTDLAHATKGKDVSQDTRNTFWNTLLTEHSLPGVREQLHDSWTKWLESNYAEEPVLAAAAVCLSMDTQTPPDDNEIVGQYGEKEEMAPAGLGGAGLAEGEHAAAAEAQAGGGPD